MAKKVKAKKAASKKETAVDPKELLKDASAALTAFLKKNKLARDKDHSKDKKFGKEYKELTLAVEKATEAVEGGKAKAPKAEKAKSKDKAKKEGSSSAGRAAKYDYPPGLTAAEKKEFRVKARKAEKAAAKGDSAPSKKSDKGSKSSKEEKSSSSKKSDAKGGKKEVAKVETKDIKKDKKKKKGSKSKND